MGGIFSLVFLLSALQAHLCIEVIVCPAGCDCQGQTFDCSGRGLTEIPHLPRPSSNKRGGVTLLLNNNSLTGLQKQAFQDMYISKLDLSDNQVGGSVSDQAFSGMLGVSELVMERCALSSVPTAVAALEDLTSLSLRENQITSIPPKKLNKLIKLKHLDLAENRVRFSQFSSFDNLTLLETLDISGNNLYTVPTGALRPLLLLKTLILEGNNIQVLKEQDFVQNGNITTLNMLDNPMQRVHAQALSPLNKLETLEISDCILNEFNRSNFGNKPKLNRLTLKNCQIDSVDAGLVHDIVKNLMYLDISGSHALWDVLRNKLHDIGGNLEVLNLSSLQIKDVPTSIFKDWNVLSKLDLQSNEITQLKESAFEGLRGSEIEIHLENNYIREIQPYLFKDTNLPLSLFLNNNTNLTSLDFISGNPCAFDRSTVDVSGINFSCNCETVKVVQKKLVSLNGGYCGEGSTDGFEGLQLGPDYQTDSTPIHRVHLEPEGMIECDLENHLDDKYSCCNEDWVTLGTPITCPVKDKAIASHISALSMIVCLLSLLSFST